MIFENSTRLLGRAFLYLTSLLLLGGVCLAQPGVSQWNSSTGSTVEIFLNANSDPTGVRLSAKGKKPLEYSVSKVTETWFEYVAGNTTMRATFTAEDEITLTASSGGNSYRWTRRNGKARYPIPNTDQHERCYWRTEGSQKKYLTVLSPQAASVMIAEPVQGKQRYKAYRCQWLDYPKTLQIGTSPPRTLRFLNPMLLRDGSTYWFQSDSRYEDKK